MLLIPRGFPLILWGKTMELSVFISLRSLFPNILGSIDTFRHTRLVQCPYPEEELSVIMCVDYAVSVTQLKTITNRPAFHLKKKKRGRVRFFFPCIYKTLLFNIRFTLSRAKPAFSLEVTCAQFSFSTV